MEFRKVASNSDLYRAIDILNLQKEVEQSKFNHYKLLFYNKSSAILPVKQQLSLFEKYFLTKAMFTKQKQG